MPRRFITKQDIDEAADAGLSAIDVGGCVTITDVAREHARVRGVDFVEGGADTPAGAAAAATPPPAAPQAAAPQAADLHADIRAAVISRVGMVPDGLDAVINKVLAAR